MILLRRRGAGPLDEYYVLTDGKPHVNALDQPVTWARVGKRRDVDTDSSYWYQESADLSDRAGHGRPRISTERAIELILADIADPTAMDVY